MTNRHAAPLGAPCWVDLWTSDIQGSRQFYAELFGWQAQGFVKVGVTVRER
jgi:predicted enzyme related to lactoylglutathione lyase